MPKYYQRPDGLYETSRTVDGKRIRFRGRTCAEVDRKILEWRGVQLKGQKTEAVIDAWWEQKQNENISRSTVNAYGTAVERIRKYFTGKYVKDIRPIDVLRYVRAFESQGYARNTVGIEITVLKQIFSFAVLFGDIDVSPAVEVKRSRNLPQTIRTALTEEQEALVEQCRTGKWWLFGLMLLYTGCRKGELLALNWQDIDRAEGIIHITKKLNYSYSSTPRIDNRLKSENGRRDIPIFQPLADALPRGRRIGPIFTNEDGTYLTASQYTDMWESYCRDAGLTITDDDGIISPAVTAHCFRHSFSTICFEAGIDPKDYAAFMGDTEDVARKVYTELRAAHHASSAEKLNAYFAIRAAEREAE